jgi:hypothetical protein
MVKPNKNGDPVQAKTRVVALGYHEERIWSKSDKFALVLRGESSRLMTSMAVESGRREKQGDCKNAFCQLFLPKDETIIIRPPKGCPLNQPGNLWLLHKTLYSLRWSPYHWYQAIKTILLSMGLTMSPHDPLHFSRSPPSRLSPNLYRTLCGQLQNFSLSNETEKLFKTQLGSKCRVDFIGKVSWFLRSDLPDGRLTVSITQTAKAEELLETHGKEDCNAVDSPYCSGFVFDRIPDNGIPVKGKAHLVKRCQSLVRGLLWLQRHTRPNISTPISLLSYYSHNPSAGHYKVAKCVLAYLQGMLNQGIRFTHGGPPLYIIISFPTTDRT